MKEYPILFSTEMIKAILDGRKTQTRRVLKIQPFEEISQLRGPEMYEPAVEDKDGELEPGPAIFGVYDDWGEFGLKFPYGQIGDHLWVRETWMQVTTKDLKPGRIIYKADGWIENEKGYTARWKQSIFMPRWASRITLEIVNVRIQRIQDISEEDAVSEGVERAGDRFRGYMKTLGEDYSPATAGTSFSQLWDSINAKRGFGWAINPWVWVIEFKQIENPQ